MVDERERAAALLEKVVTRLRSGNKGYPAARALLEEAFAADAPGCRRLALELVSLLIDSGARDVAAPATAESACASGDERTAGAPLEAAPAACRTDALHEADARRHCVLCAMILDCALGVAQSKATPLDADVAAALGDKALTLGGLMPSILRKVSALCGLCLDQPPVRLHALRAATMLMEDASGSAHREAALLLAAVRVTDAELGGRATALLDSLVAQGAWTPAITFARASPALQRHLVAGCVRANEHKRALALVKQFNLGPASAYEHIYVHLEMGRVIWLVRSGFTDLVHAVLREAADALLLLRAAAADVERIGQHRRCAREAPASAGAPVVEVEADAQAAEEWPLSIPATIDFARQVLALMATRNVPLDDGSGSPPTGHGSCTPACAPTAQKGTAVAHGAHGSATWLVRRLAPAFTSDEVLGWWGTELALLCSAPPGPPPAHRALRKVQAGLPFLTLSAPARHNIVDVDSEASIAAMLATVRDSASSGGSSSVKGGVVEGGCGSGSDMGTSAASSNVRRGGVRAIGIDSEWRPTGFLVETRCALLQLALPHIVFLIDLHALLSPRAAALPASGSSSARVGADDGRSAGARALDSALCEIFADVEITKLAFGLREEFKTLHASFPHMAAFDAKLLRSAVCVQEQHARWQREATARAKPPARTRAAADGVDVDAESSAPAAAALGAAAAAHGPKLERASLSSVCATLLGCQLDKTPQMSDWERRPLTAEQRHYAALDAHCLLELHELMLR